ncbi:AraC family transcriptional regulator [Halomonas sp. DP5Y7-2]|uniref:helix-turn-helix transcriptional regulator n=1 Tax=Halomonas sp. DP5Y7-2 TaxID=2859076 RepID=UPI001C994737|nr:AraC family transcriptional regulator [Halomonas sp. DP5Y7-2]MBY5982788.1 AraC family transcriptional regulator [Halomonas sp. DP5Y7-2]
MPPARSRPLVGAPAEGIQPRLIRAGDFLGFAQRHGIDYRFAGMRSPQVARDLAVLRGRVIEEQVRPGWHLTFSDVEVLTPYDSCSTMASPLFVCVVLEGAIQVDQGGRRQRLSAGSALSARLADQVALRVHQDAGQRLRTLNLSLDEAAIHALSQRPEITELLDSPRPHLHVWPLPGYLAPMLEQAVTPQPSAGQRQLLLEAIGLQLLAHGLRHPGAHQSGLQLAERQRLERVRQTLHDAPAHPYSLEQLAELASMSQSGLRAKFQRLFGVSVFDYLRERRLMLAYELLSRGASVQQAAFDSGYGHASNFSTAFRRRFGVSPRDVG